MYPPPQQLIGQSSYQTSSHPTSHPGTPLGKYALFLKECYTLHKAPSTKWPYLDAQKYINLAVISNVYTNRKDLMKFRHKTIRGSVDDVLDWKPPIEMKDILKPNNVQESKGCPVTQLLIEGAPGIGKSTFAWEVCQKWGQHQLFNEYSLVVLFKFRDKRVQEAKSISDLFYYPLPEMQSEIVRDIVLSCGQGLLLILEGFDEAPASKQTMDTVFVRLFSGQELPKATVIMTTRPSASAELRQLCSGDHSRRIEVVGFRKKEIDQYIGCAFSDERLLSDFTKYLSLYPHIHALMYVPLNSAIVVEVFKSCSSSGTVVPKTMTQLYSSLIRSLLLRYLNDREEYRDTCTSIRSFKDLTQPVYNQFRGICKLAYTGIMSAETQLIFQDVPSDFDHLGLMQTSPELYVDSGAFVSYNFLHLTIQEYLAAYYITLLSRDEQVAFMKEHIANKNLEVVMRFLAGFSLSELGQDSWDVVGQFASECLPSLANLLELGERKVVKLQILHWLFESQSPSAITTILGFDHVCFYHVDSSAQLPFDWYVLGYCIIHSSCGWKLELRHCKLESFEMLLKALKLQQERFLLPSKGQIKHLIFSESDPAALHLLVVNIPQMLVFHNLTHLRLCDSNLMIGFEDCKALSDLLTSSNCLEELDITSNTLSPDSIQLIVDGLSHSTSLEKLHMSRSNFSQGNVLSLASVLGVNTRLKVLDIRSCNIQSSDSIYLAKALEENTTTQLQILRLSDNTIGSEGAVAFAAMLATNKSLANLYMSRCSIKSEGAVCLAEVLANNFSLKIIVLSGNPIGSAGEIAFAGMLATNKSLTNLYVGRCSIEGEGAVCLAESLAKNSTLMVIDLSDNTVGSVGAVAFAGMLTTNESLTELHMNGCNILREGAFAFSTTLKTNQCLKTLELIDESVGAEGVVCLIESLKYSTTLGNLKLSHKCKPSSFSEHDPALSNCVEFC